MYDGVVTKAGNTGGGEGLSINIRSTGAKGETSSYWHLSSAGVKPGDVVKGGQLIGTSGTSGNGDPRVSGREAHLHVRKQVNGKDKDPGVPK